ncbi:MAG: phosphatidylserine decarboxylase [Verrucomicrobiota bacterium]|jgi:phosphatidylserine decarboxylase
MKHSGKARRAAFRIVFWTLLVLLALLATIVLATVIARHNVAIASALAIAWCAFAAFTLYFFRDPAPATPNIPNAIVSPAQGKVDLIDETAESEFMGGPCRRISIFLSVIDVHVQRAPITGQLVFSKHKDGQFLSATKCDCGDFNENALLGFTSTELAGRRLAVRLIAGLIARRINVWTQTGDTVARGELISLIQFGSRTHLYLPLDAKIHVKLGDRVKVGETLVASF